MFFIRKENGEALCIPGTEMTRWFRTENDAKEICEPAWTIHDRSSPGCEAQMERILRIQDMMLQAQDKYNT